MGHAGWNHRAGCLAGRRGRAFRTRALRRFVLAQQHQGQVTVPRLVAQLRGIGVAISKRQMMRLLIAGQDRFLAENRDVLRAGLQTAAWVSADRHRRAPCRQERLLHADRQ